MIPEDRLDLGADVVSLTTALVDIPSESHDEGRLADAVEAALQPLSHLRVERDGNTVFARTDVGRAERVILGGHLDTVPAADNLPAVLRDGRLAGLGSCDMKGGVAVALKLAHDLTAPGRDVTYLFYECEEVDERHNGLRRLAEQRPEVLAGDFAVLMEPTGATVEGGCQGSLRAEVRTTGRRAHSARSWLGENAIHAAGTVLDRLATYRPREPEVDGLRFHEGLNAVGVTGGVAGNVIPDSCVVTVNYRFAPDRSVEQAEAHLREVFDGFAVEVVDRAAGALPGLTHPAAAAFVAAVGGEVRPKFGWTDVARFSALGVPAVNFGPGDPSLAHTREEYVEVAELVACEQRMAAWLA